MRRNGVSRRVAAGMLVAGIIIGLVGSYAGFFNQARNSPETETVTSKLTVTAMRPITVNQTTTQRQTAAPSTTTRTETRTRETTVTVFTATSSANYSTASTSIAPTTTTTTATVTMTASGNPTGTTTEFLAPTTTVTVTQSSSAIITVTNVACESGAAQNSTCFVGMENTGNALDLVVTCSLSSGTSVLKGGPVPISAGGLAVAICTGAPADTTPGEPVQGIFTFYSGAVINFTGIYS